MDRFLRMNVHSCGVFTHVCVKYGATDSSRYIVHAPRASRSSMRRAAIMSAPSTSISSPIPYYFVVQIVKGRKKEDQAFQTNATHYPDKESTKKAIDEIVLLYRDC